ncbi:5' nucleotidase, NT5C type [Antrihabitans stalactiti]|uniref:Uncharacterized protein n=1 Tax=Antrihabitans stalactiti TaxID=2584121 RepID=A0A848KQE5_9NOCA|nr:hypothetical protein [Antrihabitans stalactiti]
MPVKKILYVDLDNTLVHFQTGIDKISRELFERHENDLDEVPGIFALMEPLDGALDAYRLLATKFDTYILSTAPWKNPTAWHDKLEWVQKHFGFESDSVAYKRLILSHHKNLNRGDFLVDDRHANGAAQFEGEWIQFGSARFSDWDAVTEYLLPLA